MRLRRQHIVRFAIAIVLAILLIGLWLAYVGVSTSLRAECALHANCLVIELITEYAANNNGAWPRSWHDLEMLPSRQHAMFQWPADREKVEQYVLVDFEADPDKLAMESVENFKAVKPIGPYYSYDNEIEHLLHVIQQTRKASSHSSQ